jgi:hypothetical protein
VLSGDSVTVQNAAYNFASVNAGNGIAVSESGATLSNSDYTLAPVGTTTANITPKTLTATISANNKTYDQTTAATGSASLVGVVAGDNVGVTGDTYAFNAVHAGNNLTVTESGASLTNANGNYTLGSVGTTTANIMPLALNATITANSKTYDQSTATTGSMTLSGVLTGDTVTVANDAYNFSTPHAGNNLTVTESGATLSDSDYTLGTVGTTTANISPKTLTASISANNKTYDATTAATGSMTLNGVVGNDNPGLSGDTYSFASAHAGTQTVTESGAMLSNSDYTLGSVNNTTTATINPAPLTAWVNAPSSMTYSGGPTPSQGSVVLSGLVGGNQLSYTGASLTLSNGGNVGTNLSIAATGGQLTGSGNMASNYYLAAAVAPATGITVTPATLTAAVVAPSSMTYSGGVAPSQGSVVLSGLLGGNQLSYTGANLALSNGGNVGTNLSITATGGGLSGNSSMLNNYVFAGPIAPATGISVTPAPLTASLSIPSTITYSGSNTPSQGSVVLNGLLGGNQVSYSGATLALSNGNAGAGQTVTATGGGLSGSLASNYMLVGSIAPVTGITVAPAALTLPFTVNPMTYNGTTVASATLGALTGLLGSNNQVSVTGTPSFTYASPNVGANAVTAAGLSLTGASAGNYTLNYQQRGTATISPATIAVNFTPSSRTYNGTNAATVTLGNITGIVPGTQVQLTGTPTFSFTSTNAGANTVTGTGYSLTGPAAGNYLLSYVQNGSASITQAPLYYNVAGGGSRSWGQPNPTFTGTLTGTTYGASLSSLTSGTPTFTTTATQSSAPGTYPVNGSGVTVTNPNYTLTQAPNNLSGLTVTALAAAIVPQGASTMSATGSTASYTVTGGNTPRFTVSYSGPQNSFLTNLLSQITFQSNIPANNAPGTYQITAVIPASLAGVVTVAPINVTIPPVSGGLLSAIAAAGGSSSTTSVPATAALPAAMQTTMTLTPVALPVASAATGDTNTTVGAVNAANASNTGGSSSTSSASAVLIPQSSMGTFQIVVTPMQPVMGQGAGAGAAGNVAATDVLSHSSSSDQSQGNNSDENHTYLTGPRQ